MPARRASRRRRRPSPSPRRCRAAAGPARRAGSRAPRPGPGRCRRGCRRGRTGGRAATSLFINFYWLAVTCYASFQPLATPVSPSRKMSRPNHRALMNNTRFAVLILAAGQGTRMKSALPKVLHRVANRPMIQHVLAAAAPLKPARTIVVVAPGMDAVVQAVAPAETVVQMVARGTGHAVMSARPALADFAGDVLIMAGDAPLVTTETLSALLAE